MMRVAAGFHIRDDDWILPRKLEALAWCDRVVVLLDRCPNERLTRSICGEFPNVEVHVHRNSLSLPDEGPDGPICEEGIMRQETWDLLADSNPDWIVLGDADEIPTPDVVRFFEDPPDVDLCYVHMVQLFRCSGRYISGPHCIWSWEHPDSNKKGAFVRFDPGRHRAGEYRYDLKKLRHTRLEPSPLHSQRSVCDSRHVLIDTPKLLHWKWVNWDRWDGSSQAGLEKYRKMWEGIQLDDTPQEWLW